MKPLAIVGGLYFERCRFPQWQEVFGSGLRAACAVSSRRKVSFHCFAHESALPHARANAGVFGFSLHACPCPKTYGFDYLHPLSRPNVSVIGQNTPCDPLVLEDVGDVLAYGMMEGIPRVHAKTLVYDPQSPLSPQMPGSIPPGGAPERTALVMNAGEARIITKADTIERAGRILLGQCDVAVIKDGYRGAHVFTEKHHETTAAYRIKNCFPIGSGDVFSAVFASLWTEDSRAPLEAAAEASLATALYCSSKVLPLPRKIDSGFHEGPMALNPNMSIYLASPFFSPDQLFLVEDTKRCLEENGVNVFSPFHHVGTAGNAASIAGADLEALRHSQCVLALVDGWDPGTLFEIGFARALGIRVVAMLSSCADSTHTLMLEGSGCEIVPDLATGVHRALCA